MLAKSIRPLPNLKEKDGKVFFSFDDTELRYRKRYLDIIANQHVKDVFVKRENRETTPELHTVRISIYYQVLADRSTDSVLLNFI